MEVWTRKMTVKTHHFLYFGQKKGVSSSHMSRVSSRFPWEGESTELFSSCESETGDVPAAMVPVRAARSKVY